MSDRPWHSLGIAELAAGLDTDATRGLVAVEAARRLASEGPNELRREEATSPITSSLDGRCGV